MARQQKVRSSGAMADAMVATIEMANDIADGIIKHDGYVAVLGIAMGVETLYRNKLDAKSIEEHCTRLIELPTINDVMLLVWYTLIARANRDNSRVGGPDTHRAIMERWAEFVTGKKRTPWSA